MNLQLRKSFVISIGLVTLFAAACSKSGNSSYNPNWMDDSPFQRANYPMDSGYKNSLSSASLNSLNSTDAGTLNNLVAKSDDVLPEDLENLMTAAMQRQAEYIAQQERAGKVMAEEKFQLHQAASVHCMQQADNAGSPIDGNDMMGTWSGLLCEIPGKGKKGAVEEYTHYRGTKKKDKQKKKAPAGEIVFEVSSGGAPGQLVASGGINGNMTVRGDIAVLSAGTWIGQINSRQWAGEFANGTYNKVGEYNQSCKIKVRLRSSADPDLQRMVDGTRILAACYGNIMTVLSPTSDRMFQAMDKDLAFYMKLKLLGLN